MRSNLIDFLTLGVLSFMVSAPNLMASNCDYKGEPLKKARLCLSKVVKEEFGNQIGELISNDSGGTHQTTAANGNDLFLVQLNYSATPGKTSVTGILECNEKTGALEVKSLSFFLPYTYGVKGSNKTCQ